MAKLGKNNKMMIIDAATVQLFTLTNLRTEMTPLLILQDPLLFKAKGNKYYFQPTSLKIMSAFALLSPNLDSGMSCSLNSPQDFNNSDGSTFSLTGYS